MLRLAEKAVRQAVPIRVRACKDDRHGTSLFQLQFNVIGTGGFIGFGLRLNPDIVNGPPPVIDALIIPLQDHITRTGWIVQCQCICGIERARACLIKLQQNNLTASIEPCGELTCLRFLTPTGIKVQYEAAWSRSANINSRRTQ